MMKKKQSTAGIGILFLTVFIYFFTVYPESKKYSFHLLIFSLLLFLSAFIFKRKNFNFLIYSGLSFTLLVVGISGWFFSPFFSWLYILAIALSFLYNQMVSVFFVGLLIALLLPNVGSIDLALDTLMILSLFFIIPLSYFLRLEYLKLKESEKGILIIKQENQRFKTILDEVLSNKITKLAVQLRESLNDIRQIVHYKKRKTPKDQKDQSHDQIIALAEKGLTTLKKFEEQATGIKLVKTPK